MTTNMNASLESVVVVIWTILEPKSMLKMLLDASGGTSIHALFRLSKPHHLFGLFSIAYKELGCMKTFLQIHIVQSYKVLSHL